MIPPDKLRALLADHPPQAYMSKDQEKIRDVWDAAREMLRAVEALRLYESARDEMFAHCLSNGVFNAWGLAMNCAQLNDAHSIAQSVLTNFSPE